MNLSLVSTLKSLFCGACSPHTCTEYPYHDGANQQVQMTGLLSRSLENDFICSGSSSIWVKDTLSRA
jgi:hypothetical protein